MTSIIIAGRANSEETTECIYVAMNIANMYPSSRFTIVLKSKKEWEKYCEDICNLFGIVKKTHPLILFSNGNQIGGQQEFFKLISESFTYDNIIKKGDEYILNIEDNNLINKLTKENSLQVEKEYNCRMKGKYLEDKIKEKLDQIPVEHFDTIYNKYNTIESDYDTDFIDDMNVYVKYDEKFTPNGKDYKEEQEVIETKVSYVEKEEYDNYHAELQAKKEAEEKRKALEEDLKTKKENLDKLKEEGNLTPEDEEKLQNEINDIENQLNPPKEEKKENEENNNENNEENNNNENNNEENVENKEENVDENNNNNETEEKKEEEEKKTEENNNNNPEEKKEVQIDPETGLPIENPENIPKPKEYKEVNYVCYPDFDIPVEYFEKEILVESFPNENFELLINPYFTFYGETLINRIKDYQGPKAVVKPKPEIPAPVEVNPDEIVADEQINVDDKNKKDNKKDNKNDIKKDNKDNKKDNKDNKKDTKNDTKNDNKKDNATNNNENNENNTVPNSNTIIENGVELPKPEIKPPREHNPYLPTTYEPNFPPSKQILYKIMIKDYGKLPSLRLMKFEGEDLKFYFDEIPPYQLPEHMKNESNLFNFDENDLFLFNDNDLNQIISIINKTDSYINFKILPYKFTDWKSLNSNKIKVIPKICKDIKNKSFPLFDKIYQTIQKIKRDSFVLTKNLILKENSNERPNFENILNNSDFDPIFEIPDFFTLENYEKHGIKHLIKFFQKNTFNILNIKLSIKDMMKKLDINNVNGNGLIFIICKDFIFMAPLTEPFTYTKEKNVGDSIVPIFAEPYYFMGIFTLPIIEADWPESVERKNVKFDLIEILRKSTN